MKKYLTTLFIGLLSVTQQLWAEPIIKDKDMGLSKSDVFETPTPKAFSYSTHFPGTGETIPRAFAGAPPQIPHNISSFKPITAANNMCMGCHHNPAMIGQRVKGLPTSMPASHYTDVRNKPSVQGKEVIGARYVCTQCHVPQAQVDTLVDNLFAIPK